MAADPNGKHSVLSFTHESSLMLTRQLLLEREGYTVVTASTLTQFCDCLMSGTFDLLLLCQSVSPSECEAVSQAAREYAPSARLLMMINRIGKCVPGNADVLLDSLAGPKVFLQTAQRLLRGAPDAKHPFSGAPR